MTALVQTLKSSLHGFQKEVQNNSRLRWMSMAAVLVFLIWLVLLADDFRVAKRDDYIPLQRQLVRLQGIAASSSSVDYETRLAAESDITLELETHLWRAESQGLAGADFQAWLQSLARISGFEEVFLNLSEAVPQTDMQRPMWRLEAQLGAVAEPAQVAQFLAGVANSEKMVVIQRINYVPERKRVRMLVVAHFLLDVPAKEPT